MVLYKRAWFRASRARLRDLGYARNEDLSETLDLICLSSSRSRDPSGRKGERVEPTWLGPDLALTPHLYNVLVYAFFVPCQNLAQAGGPTRKKHEKNTKTYWQTREHPNKTIENLEHQGKIIRKPSTRRNIPIRTQNISTKSRHITMFSPNNMARAECSLRGFTVKKIFFVSEVIYG